MNQDSPHRLTPLAIFSVFVFVIPGLVIGNLFAFAYVWLMHVSMIERLINPRSFIDLFLLVILPQLASGLIASLVAMRVAFAIKFLKHSNYEIVAYAIAGIAIALDAFPLWFVLANDGFGIRAIENISNLVGIIIGTFIAFRSIRSGTNNKDLLGGVAMGAFSTILIIGTLAYTGATLYAAYLGIGYYLGNGWTIGILIVSMFLRFTLPLAVGAFLGAMNVWHWHWALALLFAAPGLVFMIPGMIGSFLSAIPRRRAPKSAG